MAAYKEPASRGATLRLGDGWIFRIRSHPATISATVRHWLTLIQRRPRRAPLLAYRSRSTHRRVGMDDKFQQGREPIDHGHEVARNQSVCV